MSTIRKFGNVLVAAGLGVAIWTALPGSPATAVAGSSVNVTVHGGSLSAQSGSSVN